MAFMYAPMFHPAMKFVMPARRALGFRTFFNILGPMCNPAGVKRYVIGAFSKKVAEQMAMILSNLDTEFAYTFNSHDGLDEVSTTSDANIFEIKDHMVSTAFNFSADSLGFNRVEMSELIGGGAEENAEIFRNILSDKATAAQRDIVILNATFAIQASGKVNSLLEARELAEESLYSGAAKRVFESFIQATNEV
jgi:anthranilate phosphoribosyltransferase